MATASDSQGLKIAVAIFVSLTVILAVTAYFMYSEYDKASTTLAETEAELRNANSQRDQANADFIRLRDRAGFSGAADANDVMTQIEDKQQELVAEFGDAVSTAINTLNSADPGQDNSVIESFQNSLNSDADLFRRQSSTPSGGSATFSGSLDTLVTIASNQAKLATDLAIDNIRLRRQLESVNNVNQQDLDTQLAEVDRLNQLLRQASGDFAAETAEIRLDMQNLQVLKASAEAQLDELQNRLDAQQIKYDRDIAEQRTLVDELRTVVEKDEVVLDVPDGFVTYVNFNTGEIQTTLSRSMGARPQMLFSIFDADAPGLPSDKPKARVKLIRVTADGSVASIEEDFDYRNPIRVGDQVYSSAWDANRPQRFALIGPIDMNRDGRDDRDALIRLIEAAGGVVDYDLPPQNVGQERGELTGRISWYVIDERDPLRDPGNQLAAEVITEAREEFLQQQSQAVEQARTNGIRPLAIEHLLSSLGYSFRMRIPGVVERRNEERIRELVNPDGLPGPLPGQEGFGSQ